MHVYNTDSSLRLPPVKVRRPQVIGESVSQRCLVTALRSLLFVAIATIAGCHAEQRTAERSHRQTARQTVDTAGAVPPRPTDPTPHLVNCRDSEEGFRSCDMALGDSVMMDLTTDRHPQSVNDTLFLGLAYAQSVNNTVIYRFQGRPLVLAYLVVPDSHLFDLDVAPDGRHLAYVAGDRDGSLWAVIWDLSGDSLVLRTPQAYVGNTDVVVGRVSWAGADLLHAAFQLDSLKIGLWQRYRVTLSTHSWAVDTIRP